MAAPKLSSAITWGSFEKAAVSIFCEALRRLAQMGQLPCTEEPINLELYWLLLKVHHEMMRLNPKNTLPFSLLFDSTNQPQPDDVARSNRLRKRPDFTCVLTDPHAHDFRVSQVHYYVECKRLGQAEGKWVLNENYSEHGISRFVHPDWQYGKGCRSATMVGYLQNTAPATVLAEVNKGTMSRGLPSLRVAAAGWAARSVTPLKQDPLSRHFAPQAFSLGHLWIDLCHCEFVASTSAPRASATLRSQTPAVQPRTKKARLSLARRSATRGKSEG